MLVGKNIWYENPLVSENSVKTLNYVNVQNISEIQDHYEVIENAYKSWNKRSTKCLHADGSWAPGR